jgi:hypothetical protein
LPTAACFCLQINAELKCAKEERSRLRDAIGKAQASLTSRIPNCLDEVDKIFKGLQETLPALTPAEAFGG